jgi:hypothetical protein
MSLFTSLELIAFILPALPNKLLHRLCIVSIYFTLHYFKVQPMYSQYKHKLS